MLRADKKDKIKEDQAQTLNSGFGFWSGKWFVERDEEMVVAILYGKLFSCIYGEQHEKLDGRCYEKFVCQNFPKGFRRSGKHGSKLLVQDNCPISEVCKGTKLLAVRALRFQCAVVI